MGETAKLTIPEAIKQVMVAEGKPMIVSEIYDAIVSAGLYTFKADKPVNVVRSQVRRHTAGLSFSSASTTKLFELLPNGKYYLSQGTASLKPQPAATRSSAKKPSLVDLKALHQRYLDEFRQRVLKDLKQLSPSDFEVFCKNLLVAYGFHDMIVTRATKDGGIDGHGCLKVGITDLRVAFQCKRWKNKTIGRPEIDQFRGAIQGEYEQGIFFTTASFTSEATSSRVKPGAITVVLMDGAAIVDFMIKNQTGIETETLPVYDLALDLITGGSQDA